VIVFWKYLSAFELFDACSGKIKKCAMSVIVRVWARSGAILIKADIISYVDRRELFYKSSCCVRVVEKRKSCCAYHWCCESGECSQKLDIVSQNTVNMLADVQRLVAT
jgi:hypothetical protein